MRYSIFAGGKRIRPLLSLAAAESIAGDGGVDRALTFACAVEMIHTFSLIHDDLPAMDNDDLRRGRPTCHKKFDEATAILAGDALHTLAFDHVSHAPNVDAAKCLRAVRVLSRACGPQGLIGGQMDDLLFEGTKADAMALDRMHRAKTGALIMASVEGGAIFAGATDDELQVLRRFSEPLGLAFQIVDDILDELGTVEELGKTPGKDRRSGKTTYVALHGLDAARRASEERLEEATAALQDVRNSDLLLHVAHLIVRRSS